MLAPEAIAVQMGLGRPTGKRGAVAMGQEDYNMERQRLVARPDPDIANEAPEK